MNYIKEIIDYIGKIFTWWIIVMPWQSGVRVRLGKHTKVLHGGIYLKLPIVDEIFIQTTRMRIASLPIQTVTTKDKQTVTIAAVVGYSIADVVELYEKIHQPEATISNTVMSEMAEFVNKTNLSECFPHSIESSVMDKLKELQYGVRFESVKVIGFANVKTYRLIQDSHWMESSNIDNPK